MKKTKKLLAGLLSLAMAMSTLPVMPIGVSAQSQPDNTYLYYENFEDADTVYAGWTAKDYSETTYKAVDAKGNEITKTRQSMYTSSIVTEDGNSFMRYTRNRPADTAWETYAGRNYKKNNPVVVSTETTPGTAENEGTTTVLDSFSDTYRTEKTTKITNGVDGDGNPQYTTEVSTVKHEYNVNNSYTIFDATEVGTNANAQGAGKYQIEQDSAYEMGFKIDLHNVSGYISGCPGLTIKGAWGRCSKTFGNFNLNGGRVTYSDVGMNELISNIDGFIEVKVELNVGKTKDAAKSTSDATADVYVSYTKTDGTPVELSKKGIVLSTKDKDNYYLDRFVGMSASEYTQTNQSHEQDDYFDIDDVYFKKQASYTLTFVPMDGAFEAGTEVNADGNVVIVNQGSMLANDSVPTPESENGVFAGWFTDTDFKNALDHKNIGLADEDGDGNITLYAKYDTVYTVTFDAAGGVVSGESSYSTARGFMPAEEIPTPTYGGLRFVAWYIVDDETGEMTSTRFNEETEIKKNFTVRAKWDAAIFREDFEEAAEPGLFASTNTDLWSSEVVTVDGNKLVEYKRTSATNGGGTSTGAFASGDFDSNTWYEVSYKVYVNKSGFYGNILPWKLYANFSQPSHTYGLTTDWSGSVTVDRTATGLKIYNLDYIDVTTKFLINGDSTEGEPNNEGYPAYMNGTMITEITYKSGDDVVTMEPITKAIASRSYAGYGPTNHYSFGGLFENRDYKGSNYSIDNKIGIDDVVITAMVPNGTVTFDTSEFEGVTIPSQGIYNGKLLTVPTVDDIAFSGWYVDGKPFENDGTLSGDVTLVAKKNTIHTITFDSNGGTEFEPISTARDSIELPIPTKGAWHFVGWFKADGTEFDGTGITESMTVTARWDGILYSNDFEEGAGGMSASDSNGRYTGTWVAPTAGKDGYWALHRDGNATITNKALIKPVASGAPGSLDHTSWYKLGYTVNFNKGSYYIPSSFGGIQVSEKYNVRTSIGAIAVAYGDNTTVDGQSIGAASKLGEIKVTAWFNLNPDNEEPVKSVTQGAKKVIVEYVDANGITQTKRINGTFGSFSTSSLWLDAYTFMTAGGEESGYKSDADIYFDDIYLMLTEPTGTVTFDVADFGVDTPAAMSHYNGELMDELPTIDNDDFAGWKLNGEFFTNDGSLTDGAVLVAAHKEVVTVTFDDGLDGTDNVVVNTKTGESLGENMPATPSREGYEFMGWKTADGESFTASTKVSGEVTITAEWREIIYSTVTFNAGAGTVDVPSLGATDGVLQGTAPTPVWAGEIFEGWYIDANGNGLYDEGEAALDVKAVPAGAVTAVAKWAAKMVVTFNTNADGNFTEDAADETTTTEIGKGQTFAELTAPEREGYFFDGWKIDENTEFTVDTVVEDDMTVYATWTKAKEITFNTNGAGDVAKMYADRNGKITLPAAPSYLGYIFDGWYNGDEAVTNDTVYEADTELTAHWTAGWVISYDSYGNGQKLKQDTVPQVAGTTVKLPAPETRHYYTFNGWRMNGTGDLLQKNDVVEVDGNTTFVADWTLERSVIYTEDFEDDDFLAGWNTPDYSATMGSATGKLRTNLYKSERVTDESGNSFMRYTRNRPEGTPWGDYSGNNGNSSYTVVSVGFGTENSYVDSYSTYEMGYKINFNNSSGYWNDAGHLGVTGAYGQLNKGLGNLHGNIGGQLDHADTGFNEHLSNIDGFIDVKVVITTGDLSKDVTYGATVDTYITYKRKSDGEIVEKSLLGKQIQTGNGNYFVNSITGFSLGEYTNSTKSGENDYVDIDDVYFKMAKSYTLTFDALDGEFAQGTPGLNGDGDVVLVENGSKIPSDMMPVPTTDGYVFAYWCTDAALENRFNNNDLSIADADDDGKITLYAKYDILRTVTFDATDGELSGENTYSTASGSVPTDKIPTPTHGAWYFGGWYLEPECINAWDGSLTADITVYAKWTNEMYREGFDGVYAEGYKAPGGRWTSEVVTLEDGNKVMSYTRDSSITFTGNTYTIFNFGAAAKQYPIISNAEYITGFKIDYNNVPGYLPSTPGIVIKEGTYGRCSATIGSMNLNNGVLSNGDLGINEKVSDINGFVEVIAVIKTGDLGVTETRTGDNTAVEHNASYDLYVTYTKTDETVVKKKLLDVALTTQDGQGYTLDSFSGIGGGEWTSTTTNNGTFYIDDIYFSVKPEMPVVTFVSNGGTEIAAMDADPLGDVDLTAARPEKTDYVFAGWFKDAALKVPFDGTGVFADMTAYARWQQAPKVTGSLPTGALGVNSDVKVTFDSEMIAATLTEDTIRVYRDGVAFDKAAYDVAVEIDPETRNTTAIVKFSAALDYDSEYTVVVTTDAANTAGNLETEWSRTFKTQKMSLTASDWSVWNKADNSEVTSVNNIAGKTLIIKYNVTLNAAN